MKPLVWPDSNEIPKDGSKQSPQATSFRAQYGGKILSRTIQLFRGIAEYRFAHMMMWSRGDSNP